MWVSPFRSNKKKVEAWQWGHQCEYTHLSSTFQWIWSAIPGKRVSIAQRFDESRWVRVFSGIASRVFRSIQWTPRSCKEVERSYPCWVNAIRQFKDTFLSLKSSHILKNKETHKTCSPLSKYATIGRTMRSLGILSFISQFLFEGV